MIYLISGLGADERVFQKLDFGGHPTVFLPWLIPDPNESPEAYLKRFAQPIRLSEPVILIGVSFGGIIALELARQIPVEKLILISTVKAPEEFSKLIRFLKWTKLYTWFPARRYKKRFRFLSHYYFGSHTNEEKESLDQLISESDNRIIDWSVHYLFHWKKPVLAEKIYHIHGTRDRIFPIQYIRDVIPVEGGTHFMIANRAGEVSRIIQYILDQP